MQISNVQMFVLIRSSQLVKDVQIV